MLHAAIPLKSVGATLIGQEKSSHLLDVTYRSLTDVSQPITAWPHRERKVSQCSAAFSAQTLRGALQWSHIHPLPPCVWNTVPLHTCAWLAQRGWSINQTGDTMDDLGSLLNEISQLRSTLPTQI